MRYTHDLLHIAHFYIIFFIHHEYLVLFRLLKEELRLVVSNQIVQ